GLDEAVCGVDADGYSPVDTMGTAQLTGEIRRRVQALDPAAVVRRNAKAEKARRVTIRPTPDTMVYLNGLLPVAQGVAAYAALTTAAASLISQGDERSKAQIMADLMVERLTGQTAADDVAVTIDVVISDQALLGAGHESAVLPDAPGAPTIPAQVARNLAAHTLSSPTTSWVRSLYADPTGRLVAMSTRQRFTTDGLADLLKLRDQGICRTPWCDAPIRHTDHITPAAVGGQTTESNTQGLCQACNFAKQADGWSHRTVHDDAADRHTVETTTPTGHRHRSRAPAPPTPARTRQGARRRPALTLYYPAFDIDISEDPSAA
ncbi:HNH endonuclease, partial [Nocardioides sp.]|uniref:HNH endonuclease n=1 Tax=Nocardioides sp. TaxID=35761 RepID=UPI002B2793EF